LLALAITEVESGGDTYAVRYEPNWKYLYNVEEFAKLSLVSLETEKVCQMMSWGLMQVMGAVARECGFEDRLPQLIDPRCGAKYGCNKLKKLFRIHKTVDDVIASYNAGSPIKRDGKYVNQGYVDKVRAVYGIKPESL